MEGLLGSLQNALQNQWQQGEPYRVAVGGLLSGDTQPLQGLLGAKTRMNPMTTDEAMQMALDWSNPIAGIAGTFIGKGAKTWNAANAEKAAKLLKEGVDPRKVWKETGTFIGADGVLRQEIADTGAKYRAQYSDPRFQTVNHQFQHDDLLEAYPDIGNIKLYANEPIAGASYSSLPNSEVISVGRGGPDKTSSTLHEIQHAIQQREGWAKGGGYDYEIYKKLAGEAEARATQARLGMDMQQRLNKYPFDSFDMPISDLIIRNP